MNKRLSKKVHKKYINDICYDISLSSLWRKRLFESIDKKRFLIGVDNLNELPKYIKSPIVRYKLKYYVYKTEEILDEDFYYEGGVFFKFEAVKFNKVSNYSFNNLRVV